MPTAPVMRVLSVARGRSQPLPEAGVRPRTNSPVLSAIRKAPCSSLVHPDRIALTANGVVDDEQADRRVHGGPLKAVYVYPAEHYAWWQTRRDEAHAGAAPLAFGAFGENLTLEGLLESDVWIGDSLQIGDCVLRVESPRRPCYKFNAVMGYRRAARDMLSTGRSGFYLSVQQAGTLSAGDAVRLIPGPRLVTLTEVNRQRFAESGHELF
jgi:MOSC domain-containing protein YiiM